MKLRGKVKWFNDNCGYGMIRRKSGRDVFVHYREIAGRGFRTLSEGDIVEYEIGEGSRGLHALNVRTVSRPGEGEIPGSD